LSIKFTKIIRKTFFGKISCITNHRPLAKAKSLQQGKCRKKARKIETTRNAIFFRPSGLAIQENNE
jgi:hypothetical protein